MIVKGCSESYYQTYIPDTLILLDDSVIGRDGSPTHLKVFRELEPFELPEDKWFAIDDGVVVRFPKSREWDWRTKKAIELISVQDPHPERALQRAESAAGLVGSDLPKIIELITEAKKNKESLESVVKRLIDELKKSSSDKKNHDDI